MERACCSSARTCAAYVVGGEDGRHAPLVEAALGGEPLQHLVVVDGEALAEVGGVEALDGGGPERRPTHLAGEGAQPVGVEGVGAHGRSQSKTRSSASATSLALAFISRPAPASPPCRTDRCSPTGTSPPTGTSGSSSKERRRIVTSCGRSKAATAASTRRLAIQE